MAIKEHFGNQALQNGMIKTVARDPSALEKYRILLAEQNSVL